MQAILALLLGALTGLIAITIFLFLAKGKVIKCPRCGLRNYVTHKTITALCRRCNAVLKGKLKAKKKGELKGV